jgi:hypothetical protein
MGEHALGAVEQAEALLWEKLERLDSSGLQHRQGGDRNAIDEDLPLTDERKGEVGERRQVTGCPNRALRWHRRDDVVGKQSEKEADDLRANT